MILLLLLLRTVPASSEILPRLLAARPHYAANPVCVVSEPRSKLDLSVEFVRQVSQWADFSLVQLNGGASSMAVCSAAVIFLEVALLRRISPVDILQARRDCRILMVNVYDGLTKDMIPIYEIFAKVRGMPKIALLSGDGLFSLNFFSREIDRYRLDKFDFRRRIEEAQGYTLKVMADGIFIDLLKLKRNFIR